MGGMGASGVGRRHGEVGLLKYTEAQTVATQRVTGMAGPSWLPPKLWSRILPVAVKSMSYLPGR